ncbi:MerR family transcriptional regulator [Micromonospora sp. CPCC 206061]|uniref:MerR family transcriptional regulator n=1 Tax=Micromonospora sp. CPCC 206061 TaxID=3122410 RepID=UPI002FF2278E
MADEGLSAGAAARRLGVAVTTLRTWHQRYGLGPSEHVPGHHRRYTAEDLARLDVMRELTAEGVAPAEAARWARGTVPRQVASRRHGGGRVIAVGAAGDAARGLAHAAMRLDATAMREIIERSITTSGVVPTWDTLLRPVLSGVGERHAVVEVEHLLSRCVSEALGAVPRPPAAAGPPRILLACADEEQHSLPLEALAAALAEVGVACRLLGARVPPSALAGAVRRTGPDAVMVWSHSHATADPRQLDTLRSGPHRPPLIIAAGPGWDELPVVIERPDSLVAALTLLSNRT